MNHKASRNQTWKDVPNILSENALYITARSDSLGDHQYISEEALVAQSSKVPQIAVQSCIPYACHKPMTVGSNARFTLTGLCPCSQVFTVLKLLRSEITDFSNIKLTHCDITEILFKAVLKPNSLTHYKDLHHCAPRSSKMMVQG